MFQQATLTNTDCCEVMKRWVDHLCGTQVNQKVSEACSDTVKC